MEPLELNHKTTPPYTPEADLERSSPPRVSVLIPCFNEEESVDELIREVFGVLDSEKLSAEVVIVDDGSRDRTWQKLVGHAGREPRLKLVRFRRNFGQTAALVAAMDHASGEIFIPMDADLQNDPRSIPALLERIDEGYDVVSGWRRDRKDRLVDRKLPSMIANWLISKVSGVVLHDYGCTLKAYRREVLERVQLYGEMHRFIPVYASWSGAKVAEAVVQHRARRYGQSKYGIMRTFKVLLDLLVVKFLGSYGTKPVYFFGGIGFVFMGSGTLAALATLYYKVFHGVWVHQNPMLLVGVFLFLTGVQSLCLGLLAEIGIRTYHESQGLRTYVIADKANIKELS